MIGQFGMGEVDAAQGIADAAGDGLAGALADRLSAPETASASSPE
jgi:hypothetical protein